MNGAEVKERSARCASGNRHFGRLDMFSAERSGGKLFEHQAFGRDRLQHDAGPVKILGKHRFEIGALAVDRNAFRVRQANARKRAGQLRRAP